MSDSVRAVDDRPAPPVEDQPISPARPSRRARLAEVALDAALTADGAVAGHPGALGMFVTPGPSGTLTGVAAVADPGGRYDVSLHLVADPVPLHPLADRVRELVVERAQAAGLGETLGSVDVFIEDVVVRPPPDPPAVEV